MAENLETALPTSGRLNQISTVIVGIVDPLRLVSRGH
jgi:hypothetical protein